LADFIGSLVSHDAPNTLTSRTTRGTSRSALPGGDGGGGGELQIRGQWDVTEDYKENELVYCDTTSERDDGTQAGLYQALEDVTGGSHPSTEGPGAKWRMVARGHWSKLSIADGSGRKIIIDTSGTDSSVKIYNNAADENAGSILLDVADLAAMSEGSHQVAKMREDNFCLSTGVFKCGWLRTEFVALEE
jgi:hypothetical protein